MRRALAFVLVLLAAAWAGDLVPSPERPGGSFDDPVARPHDLSGRSIKCARVRAVHSTDPSHDGTKGEMRRAVFTFRTAQRISDPA